MLDNLKKYKIVLGTQSPRRQTLFKELGLAYEVIVKDDIDETFPEYLQGEDIVLFLADKKSKAYEDMLNDNILIITADTIVWFDNQVLGKPVDMKDAKAMLQKLSGRRHTVYTGVSLRTKDQQQLFFDTTYVDFKVLSNDEIDYYLQKYAPLDKAGAYGIQEWIGYIGVEGIEGSYFNVMGLPIQKLYTTLQRFKPYK